MIKKLAPLLIALLAAACAGDTTLSLAGLNTSCKVDKDCVTVDSGDACSCLCGNAAINVAALPDYNLQLQEKQASCTSLAACDCIPTANRCEKSQCVLVR